jgi:hypothetical protein
VQAPGFPERFDTQEKTQIPRKIGKQEANLAIPCSNSTACVNFAAEAAKINKAHGGDRRRATNTSAGLDC